MVRVVSLLAKGGIGSRKTRTKPKAQSPLKLRKVQFWIFSVVMGIATVAGVLLVVAYPFEKSNVILLPTEEGPKKVYVPASEAYIIEKPEVYLLPYD